MSKRIITVTVSLDINFEESRLYIRRLGDGSGYFSKSEIARLSDTELKAFIQREIADREAYNALSMDNLSATDIEKVNEITNVKVWEWDDSNG